jgi:tRNA(Ile)-lysidine synthase
LGLAGKRVLVAVSGGPDSVALLLALCDLSPSLGFTVEAATVDHQLRSGSRGDVRYVARLARRLGVRCHCLKVEVQAGAGLEAAARKARYRVLEALARREGYGAIATAHTLEDQVETVLMRLSRGSGLRGARGILVRRKSIVRPMLAVSRSQVKAFLAERRVRPRRDPTNDSPAFARNRVRAQVLPALERALGASSLTAIARFARSAAADERCLAALARRHAASLLDSGGASGDALRLRRLAPALRRRVLMRAARRAGARLSASQVEAIETAMDAAGPRRLTLPRGFECRVAYGRFAFARGRVPAAQAFFRLIPGEGRYVFDEAEVDVLRVESREPMRPDELRLDSDAVRWPLALRSRRPGDRFAPRGAGSKKLKALLIDAKVPRDRRDRLPLLCDARGTVLFVPGLRASQTAADGARAPRPLSVRVRPIASAGEGGRLQRDSQADEGSEAGRKARASPAGRGGARKGKIS